MSASLDESDQARSRVLTFLRAHGWNATSFQILERGFRYWMDGDDACVAYVDTGRAWVAAGAPIGSNAAMAGVAHRFVESAKMQGKRACFFAIEQRFATASESLDCLLVGEQPTWNPREWTKTLQESRSVREQLRRARAKGVTVRPVSADEVRERDAPLRRAVESLIERWRGFRTMAPMGFLVDLQPFDHCDERRYFIAEREHQVIGFLAAVPLFARNGWLFENVIRDPAAPNGTAEVLIDAAMRRAADDGSEYATLGLAPLAGEVNRPLRAIRDRCGRIYDFRGLRSFKAKFRPSAWEPVYVAWPRDRSATVALLDVLTAFARGSILRFAIESVLRGPAIVLQLLAVLLVPWTLALALVDPRTWFPSVWVQRAWVAFDVAIVLGLWAVAARWRPRLATALAAAVTFDAIVTAIEATTFNLTHLAHPRDLFVITVSCLAPAAVSAILWNARSLRLRTSGT